MLNYCCMYASHHCLEAKKDLVRKWQQSVLPHIVRVYDRRRRTASHHHAIEYGVVYIFIYTKSHSNYLCHTVVLLDAAPAWQQCPTKVESCSAIGIMCAVCVAARYQSHACWYSICDDFTLKYFEGVY